jgi:hypothetical protein
VRKNAGLVVAIVFAILALSASGTALATSPGRTYFPQGQSPSDPVYRPRLLAVAGEGSFVVERMRWSSWRRGSARGRGIGAQDDCSPDCATGTFHRAPVRVRLARPRSRCGNRIWTRMALTWTEGAPKIDGQRGPRRVVWKLGQFPCE